MDDNSTVRGIMKRGVKTCATKHAPYLASTNNHLSIRKSNKISGGKVLYFRSYQPKASPRGGGGQSPRAFRVKNINILINGIYHLRVTIN